MKILFALFAMVFSMSGNAARNAEQAAEYCYQYMTLTRRVAEMNRDGFPMSEPFYTVTKDYETTKLIYTALSKQDMVDIVKFVYSINAMPENVTYEWAKNCLERQVEEFAKSREGKTDQ